MPRITLIHALSESVNPIHLAFEKHWPEANRFDLLDNSLSADLAAAGELTSAIRDRFLALGRYAASQEGVGGKTAAILFTCSAFGQAIDAVKEILTIPVMKPNEAAFSMAIEAGERIGLLVTFPPSLPALRAELQEMALTVGKHITIEASIVENALPALKAGDTATHDQLIAAAAERLADPDAIILGQFSMARAATSVALHTNSQIITTPDAAVLSLRQHLKHGTSGNGFQR